MKVIDIHSHLFPYTSEKQAKSIGPNWPWLRLDSKEKGMIMSHGKEFRPVHSALWDPIKRIEDLDAAQIDTQIVCNTPIIFGYKDPEEEGIKASRLFNDLTMEFCQYSPDRLKALCQVPLQNIDASCREVEKSKADGHVGVQIGNHVGAKDLDNEGLVTFLHHCADIGMPVLVHPWDMMTDDRMKNYMLPWLVAMPAETQLSILSLILSGAFERLPKSLKLCFAHGGGSFAYILGRVDNAWKYRDIVRKDCPNLPSSYTDRFSVDSLTFNDEALSLLINVMGDNRVMLGSDQPFPLGEQDVGNLIKQHNNLSPKTKEKLLVKNAQLFFNL